MNAPLRSLASPRRREILRLVWRRERSAGEIRERMPDVSFPAVSQHLKRLALEGLVERRRAGRRILYVARPEALGPLAGTLETLWDDALYRLRLEAELLDSRRGPRPARRRSATPPGDPR